MTDWKFEVEVTTEDDVYVRTEVCGHEDAAREDLYYLRVDTGSGVLDREAASALRDTLTRWLEATVPVRRHIFRHRNGAVEERRGNHPALPPGLWRSEVDGNTTTWTEVRDPEELPPGFEWNKSGRLGRVGRVGGDQHYSLVMGYYYPFGADPALPGVFTKEQAIQLLWAEYEGATPDELRALAEKLRAER